MKALAQIGAWHNSLDRMPVVILVSPLLNQLLFLLLQILTSKPKKQTYAVYEFLKMKEKNLSIFLHFRNQRNRS